MEDLCDLGVLRGSIRLFRRKDSPQRMHGLDHNGALLWRKGRQPLGQARLGRLTRGLQFSLPGLGEGQGHTAAVAGVVLARDQPARDQLFD
jgi:hypothetical protein